MATDDGLSEDEERECREAFEEERRMADRGECTNTYGCADPAAHRGSCGVSALTYAKVGGPPNRWDRIEVIDQATGKPLADVVEVNAAEGWAIVYRMEDGHPVIEGDELVRDRIKGQFVIRYRRPAVAT